MIEALADSYTAFEGERRIATGALADVARAAKAAQDRGETASLLVFHDATGRQAEIDYRGTVDDVVARLVQYSPTRPEPRAETDGVDGTGDAPRTRGRPKLGVVAREVTLLPRHWDWLNRQPGGASVALRKLVDEARRKHEARDRQRAMQEAVDRFLLVMAGDRPGYEDALRAFYAKDQLRFEAAITAWPQDIRDYVHRLIESGDGDYWVE